MPSPPRSGSGSSDRRLRSSSGGGSGGGGGGPRALAEYLTSSYLSDLDVHSSHATNVNDRLRDAVLAVTERILLSPGDGDAVDVFDAWSAEDGRRIEGKEGGGIDGDGDGSGTAAVGTVAANGVGGGGGGGALGWRDYLDQQQQAPSRSGASAPAPTAATQYADNDGGGTMSGAAADIGGAPAPPAPRLSRRSLARLEGFLLSASLAVSDDPLPNAPPVVVSRGSFAAGGATSPVGTPPLKPSSPPKLSLRGGRAGVSSSATESDMVRAAKGKKSKGGGGGARGGKEALTLSSALSGFKIEEEEENGGGSSTKKPRAQSFLPEAATATATATTAVTPSASSDDKGLPPKFPSPPPRQSILRRISSAASSATSESKRLRYPQIEPRDLSVRLELYLRSLRRVRASASAAGGGDCNGLGNGHSEGAAGGTVTVDECVVHLEPPRAVRARAAALVNAFVSTVGCVRSISPVLTKLLAALTMELLAVDALSNDVTEKIARVVSEYEHTTSFASLAFLSTPEESGRAHLSPLVRNYVGYLQSEWRDLVANCELERMLREAVDPNVRTMFKTIEFRSIGHLLDVCRELRPHLERIRLPRSDETEIVSACSDSAVVRQALRDLRREIIVVNGRVLPPAHSLGELVRLLTEALSSGPLSLHDAATGKGGGRRRRRKGGMRRIKSSPAVTARKAMVTATVMSSEEDSEAERRRIVARACGGGGGGGMHSYSSESDYLSSGNEGDIDGASSSLSSGNNNDRKAAVRKSASSSSLQQQQQNGEGGEQRHRPQQQRPSRRISTTNVDLDAIDMLTRRLLVAASRTGTGGDAYFVVRDLFGGDDVEVVPSKSPVPAYTSSSGVWPHLRTGTSSIELLVRLSSVTIRCHGTYDVYPRPLLAEEGRRGDDAHEPLIQLHATTTETVALHEVRVGGAGNGGGGKGGGAVSAPASVGSSNSSSEGEESSESSTQKAEAEATAATVLMLQERRTDATGERTLSIRPASYERVHVLNTPS